MAQRQYYSIADVSGGLNLDRTALAMAQNEAAEIQNLRFDSEGSLISRKGYSRFVDSARTAIIRTLGVWRDEKSPEKNRLIFADADGNLVDGGTSSVPAYQDLQTGLQADPGRFADGQGLVVYSNGKQKPIAFDGSESYELGIVAPTNAPTLAESGSTGVGAGTYKYAYTLFDSDTGAESSIGPTASITLSADKEVGVTITARASGRVDKARVYRTLDGGEVLLYLAEVTLSSSADVTYQDVGNDLGLLIPFTDNDPPLNFEHIAYVRGYWFGSIGDELYWSKPLNPDAWPTLQQTELEFEGNDSIVALVNYQDTLFVFGRRNILNIIPDGNLWTSNRLEVDAGAVNEHSIIEVEGQLIFLSYDGLRSWPGAQLVIPRLTRTLAGLPLGVLEEAALTYVPEEKAIWLSVNGRTYTVYVPTGVLSTYTFHTTQFLQGGLDGFSYPLFIDLDRLYINQYGGNQDLGQDIFVHWVSKYLFSERPETTKILRRIGLMASQSAEFCLTVYIGERLIESYQLDLRPVAQGVSQARWDTAGTIWDNFNWAEESGGAFSYFKASLPSTLKGRLVRIAISSTINEEVIFSVPITLEYREVNRFLGV